MSEKDSRITGKKFESDYLELQNKLISLENKIDQRLQFIKEQCPTLMVQINNIFYNTKLALNYLQARNVLTVTDKIDIIKQFEESNANKHGKQLKLDLF
jgi:hypothetical protein